ncbi:MULTISPECIES: AAA family ATPase [Paracoccaceae]|uniref:AAA family ATPase n=1 Tax=Paracoccaceae TaxID=31989 RepID=UPI00157174AB|nr:MULTISPECIES: AAA family ATPase [Paracoccaceae]MBJ2153539.1 AAA family ATPase [Paracoccus sp. IB05]NTT88301.1 AAA family ATPase [Tabrizicola sp. SY72]
MIFVDRGAVPNPLLDSPLAAQAARELERARAVISTGSLQRRVEFSAYKHPTIKAALNVLFHEKCAYCETPLVSAMGDIEQFRPKSGVSEANGHPGYWWLAVTWENLLIACQYCNRLAKAEIGEGGRSESIGKANRFPLLDENKRAREPDDDINLEQPLLLDPTLDNPSPHLTFAEDGQVFSETERGNATISILGLNRLSLLQQRRGTAARYRSLFAYALSSLSSGDGEASRLVRELIEMTSSSAPYAGMVRQFLQRDRAQLETKQVVIPIPSSVDQGSLAATSMRVKRAVRSTNAFRQRMANYSLADDEGVRKYKSQRRAIETIAIRNVRAISSFDINLQALGTGAGRWLMLLGENGTGKSTVLQAIALVLGGSEYVSKLIKENRMSISDLVRFRCRSGEVAVKLSGFDVPHRLRIFRDRLEFISPGKKVVTITADGEIAGASGAPQTVIAGYGAIRLPSRRQNDVAFGGEFSRLENLFDPFAPLIDAQRWLNGLSRKDFDHTAIVLKDLLSIDVEAKLVRSKGRVAVHTSGATVSLANLSVGYQTVVALAADILEILSRVWPNRMDAEGIVLIDELDAHLHPTWQMQIVSSLRRALPFVQFISTTHQPLCLRGLYEGEVVVMHRRQNHQIEVITDLPSPADFRVDQLLTSSFFGLSSTVDPNTERLFDRYYALLALDVRTDTEKAELAQLTSDLATRKQFGSTLREGLYLEAIDQVLARRKVMPEISTEEVREEAVNEISAIWHRLTSDVVSSGGGTA